MREENVLEYFPDIHTAADLIDQSSNSWKKELTKRISHFSSAKKILSIPLTYINVQEFITSLVLRNIVSGVTVLSMVVMMKFLITFLFHVPLKELYGLHQSHN